MDIREDIAKKRVKRIEKEGYGLSALIPKERDVPIVNFFKKPFVICEVKRGSPSKGNFARGLDAVDQGKHYENSGVRHVSVLTEEDRFFGSLQDILDIKKSCKKIAVLRKDFLLDVNDVEISYLFGADAFLIIASLLSRELIEKMYNRGLELGMTPLIEVHSRSDVDKVRSIKPQLIGINSRNLKDFTIDSLRPLKIRSYIDWDTHVIYESGIRNRTDGEFARDCGFSGVLVGEWAVRDKKLAKELVSVFNSKREYSPWERLFNRYSDSKPFVKICGLTNREDVEFVSDLGADLLGFILAPSPREVTIQFIESLGDVKVLKVGVVVLKDGESLDPLIIDLVNRGLLDFIQFHGDETPLYCKNSGVPYYKAIRVLDRNSINLMDKYPKAVLIDSFSEDAMGGTGKQISRELTLEARGKANLWLAGGLTPENIKNILVEFKPDLVDISSGLESEPGIKDMDKVRKYFKEIL